MSYLKTVLLSGLVCAAVLFQATPVQSQADANSGTTSSPAAWVYVSITLKGSSVNEIAGYAAAANGALTPLPGSPWTADVSSLASNGKYLFASDKNSVYIDAFHINPSNGSLSLWSQADVAKMNSQDCGGPGQLALDRSGATVYNFEFNDGACSNNDYRSLAVNKANGDLNNLGTTQGNDWLTAPPAILANNIYAYAASCIGNMYWGVWGYGRQGNGALVDLKNFTHTLPTAPSGDFWCPSVPASDASNHVALVMQAVDGSTFNSDGGAQIASFTADASGNLTTSNITSDMPVTQIGTPLTSSMSSDGGLLAVGGTAGVQIFHFNGASAATRYTNLKAGVEIDQVFWDKQNHLYAISRTAGRLYVYAVTPSGVVEAPGSPHAIASPQGLSVLPSPLAASE